MARELTPEEVMSAVEKHLGGPLVYGATDCFSGPCAVFEALHGVDPLAGIRGTYRGPTSASKIIWSYGGARKLASACMTRAGLSNSVDVPGAIGIFRNGRGWSLANCIQPKMWAAKTDMGFSLIEDCEEAWSF